MDQTLAQGPQIPKPSTRRGGRQRTDRRNRFSESSTVPSPHLCQGGVLASLDADSLSDGMSRFSPQLQFPLKDCSLSAVKIPQRDADAGASQRLHGGGCPSSVLKPPTVHGSFLLPGSFQQSGHCLKPELLQLPADPRHPLQSLPISSSQMLTEPQELPRHKSH